MTDQPTEGTPPDANQPTEYIAQPPPGGFPPPPPGAAPTEYIPQAPGLRRAGIRIEAAGRGRTGAKVRIVRE